MKQSFLSYLVNQAKLWLKYKKKNIQLWMAIRVADQKQILHNKRFYVLPDYNGRLIALSRDDVNALKKIKVMDKRVNHFDLMRESFYYTPLNRNNQGKISRLDKEDKKRKWLSYEG